MAGERFGFAFDPRFRIPLRLVGVRPATAAVVVGTSDLKVRFGPWLLTTPLDNISGVQTTGPYTWFRVIGPHLSLADRGVSFGTNAQAGVCVTFHEPVGALAGRDRLPHPGATMTVADIDGLVAAIEEARSA